MRISGVECKISCVVVTYNMRREAARTLYTLSSDYQKMAASEFEVIVVDNGSSQPLDNDVTTYGSNVSILSMPNPSMSPAAALNYGASRATGQIIVSMIDGARMLSPGCLRGTLRAFAAYDRPAVIVPSWHLGPDVQNMSVKLGYNQAVEDRLLETRDWRNDGYALFDLCEALDPSCEGAAWLNTMAESNYIAVSKSVYQDLGGFEERFTSAGGGAVNLDFFRRVSEAAGCKMVSLFGEGTFHQFHGGISTNVPTEQHPWKKIEAEYIAIRGKPFAPPDYNPVFMGELSPQAMALLRRTDNIFTNKRRSVCDHIGRAVAALRLRLSSGR